MAAHHDALMAASALPRPVRASSVFLAIAGAAFLLPCLQSLAQGSWTTEAGALGPLVLACGAGTLWLQLRDSRHLIAPAKPLLPVVLLALAGLAYIMASAINMSTALCAAGWLAMVAVLLGCCGGAVVRQCWFPLAFLLIVIPLPYTLTIEATAALRNGLATAATGIAINLGLEAAVNGYAVYIDGYELAIESACAGLSSTVSLIAVGMLYAYWIRAAGWRRMLLIASLALPVAIVANLGRILLLMLLVHWGGMRVLAGPLHPVSGFLSFALALGLLLLIDRIAMQAQRMRTAQ